MILLSSDYPPNDGGIARLCSEIASAERSRGVPVQVVAPGKDGGHGGTSSGPGETRVTKRRIGMEWGFFRALRNLRSSGPVVCGLWYPDGLIALLAARRPLVILAHGSEIMPARAVLRRKIWDILRRRVCQSADLIVANSEYTRKLVQKDSPRAKTVAIPLGVDHVRFNPEGRERARKKYGVPGKLIITSVSRIHAYKGHLTVLQALAQLPSAVRERFVYMIAGKGPSRPSIEAEAEQLGLTASLRWLGYVPDDDLPDLYRASDLFVLCTQETASRQEVEGFGMVYLEAQACGTPVVGTKTGGIPDAVSEGDGGWLIPQDDPTALAEILMRLATEPDQFRAAGRAARERVERECTWDHYMVRFRAALRLNGVKLA